MRNSNIEEVQEIETNESKEEEKTQNEAEDVKTIPPWPRQITIRGVIASIAIGIMYSVIVMKLNLTTGLVPNLNVSAALIAFVFIKTWTLLLEKAGIVCTPFTPQENTVIQTCAVACYSIAVGGGFGSYLFALSRKTYEQAGVNMEGNAPGSTKEPGIGWITGFLSVSSFVGLLALVPLRKIMILDYKLTYPSGTATAVLINGFHTPKGDKAAKFYFDFSLTYIGAGMICSHLVNFSLLLGAVLSWGIMWPLMKELKGEWYPGSLPESSMKSLNGYKVFVSIALILGDGLYHFLKILYFTGSNMYAKATNKKLKTFPDDSVQTFNDHRRKEVFLRDSIPVWVAITGYIFFSIVSIIVIPIMFSEVKCQAIGTALGCIVAPITFYMFYKAFDLANPNGEYKVPYAIIYRNMAILGVEGFSALPQHCLQLCYGFFSFAIVANLLRDLTLEKFGKWIPLPMVMAVPFLVGAYFAIDMCVGSLIVFVWHYLNREKAGLMVPAVASGLICGEGLWILPSSILALAKIHPPICMSFFSSSKS
uniref:YSL transporter n=1 Tax=Cucumis melo subsp. melo TaxID=412675 RepID=E5GBC5_CUCME|nr:YSL transporter [Cucumis melo subsp. melo]